MNTNICKNPWCKGTFSYREDEIINGEIPRVCQKCKGFEQLSGGITWTDKQYEGDRFDGKAHKTAINVTSATNIRKW
jgi:hypothetical protein